MRKREEKLRNVKRKGELPALEMVMIMNMEPFHLNVYWSVKHQKEFKLADLYGFLKWSINMPPVDILLVEEFVRNYDPKDGSSRKGENCGHSGRDFTSSVILADL